MQTTQPATIPLRPPAREIPVRRIKPSRGLVPIDVRELWAYRSLLYLFMWRDLKTRYRQTFLSGFWAIFRPLAQMVLFSAIFGGLAHIAPGGGLPYPLFVYPGVVLWTVFTSGLTGSTLSLGANGGLLAKAYFPRLYAPFASVTAPLPDLCLSLVVIFGLFAWYRRLPSWHVVFIPAFVVAAMLVALGIGLWLTGPAVKYRDINFTIPFLAQLWMYASPVVYPASAVPAKYRQLLDINPMTSVIEGFRWAMVGSGFPSAAAVGSTVGFIVVFTGLGLFAFRRGERTVVDLM